MYVAEEFREWLITIAQIEQMQGRDCFYGTQTYSTLRLKNKNRIIYTHIQWNLYIYLCFNTIIEFATKIHIFSGYFHSNSTPHFIFISRVLNLLFSKHQNSSRIHGFVCFLVWIARHPM